MKLIKEHESSVTGKNVHLDRNKRKQLRKIPELFFGAADRT